MSRPVVRIVRVFLLSVCLASPLARAADYTDIWFTPAEPGWGANVVQSDNFLFLTFFIYGSDTNKPTWYTGQLTWDGTQYTGGLYATQGTYWNLPWVPGNVATQQVGTATFLPNDLNAYQATLTYTVTGVGTATKAIERQTLTTIGLGGAYVGGQTGSYSNCTTSSQNGPYIDTHVLTVSHNTSGAATFTFVYDSGATCVMSGTLEQHGQQYRIPGASYQCTGSLTFNTTATMYEIKATAQGVEGRLAATLPSGCQENANFSAVLR